MLDGTVFNVAIGLMLIFLLYSLFAASLQETFATVTQSRARMLYQGIESMLTNTPDRTTSPLRYLFEKIREVFKGISGWLKRRKKNKRIAGSNTVATAQAASHIYLHRRFYAHPIIKNFGQSYIFDKPSYITDKVFSSVLLEVIKNLEEKNAYTTATFNNVQQALVNNKTELDEETYSILSLHLNEAAGDLDVFRYRIEKWYNDSMDRVTGWYKRTTQIWIFAIGFVLAVIFNVNTIEIARYLSANPDSAKQLALIAEVAAKDTVGHRSKVITEQELDSIKTRLATVNTLVGLGWKDGGRKDTGFINAIKNDRPSRINSSYFQWISNHQKVFCAFTKIKDSIPDSIYKKYNYYLSKHYIYYKTDWASFLGFFITAIAICLGAPFWFDLLGKFVNIRAAGKVPNTTGVTTKGVVAGNNDQIVG